MWPMKGKSAARRLPNLANKLENTQNILRFEVKIKIKVMGKTLREIYN